MAQFILYLKERELSRHPLLNSRVRIGRDPANEIVIDNVGISRHHATVEFDGTGFVVRDEGSQNGSYVAGQRVETHSLREGDVLQLGKFSLAFTEVGAAAVPVAVSALTEEAQGGRQRDPQTTMALGAEEVAKLMAQLPEGGRGPETRREPSLDFGATEEPAAAGPPLLWIGLGLLVLTIVVGVLVLSR